MVHEFFYNSAKLSDSFKNRSPSLCLFQNGKIAIRILQAREEVVAEYVFQNNSYHNKHMLCWFFLVCLLNIIKSFCIDQSFLFLFLHQNVYYGFILILTKIKYFCSSQIFGVFFDKIGLNMSRNYFYESID